MERKLFSDSVNQSKALGLSKKPTYEDLVAYIERDPDRIKYPNRKATIVRNSFELSQLDGMGQLEISRQHEITLMNQEAQVLLQRFAQDNDLPLGDVQAYVSNLGLVPVHEHRARRILQMLGGGGEAGQPPSANNGVPGDGQVAAAGQTAASPSPPPQLAQPVPVYVANLGGVILGPPPPMPMRDPGRSHRRDPVPTPAGSHAGGYSGLPPALNQLPRFDPSRREPFRAGPLQPGSFTFSVFDPHLDNPFSFITSDNLALYFRYKRTPRGQDLKYMTIDEPSRPAAATPLMPRRILPSRPRGMNPPPTPGTPTQLAQQQLSLTGSSSSHGLLSPLFRDEPLVTNPSGTIWMPRQLFMWAMGRMSLRAQVRGADEEAEGRAQMLALNDIQRQEAVRDENVAVVSQAAQNDLAQASGSSPSAFRPVRRSRFDRRHGWDPVQPGYAPIPLGMGQPSSAASSSLGLTPEPPAADEPALAPTAASPVLPTQKLTYRRMRAKTPDKYRPV